MGNGGSHKQVTSMGGVQIAVVDASKISLAREGAPEPEDFSEVAKELCSAFQETGFAYLVNHGVDLHLVQQAMEKSLEFFSLHEGLKEKMGKGPEYQGWVAQGREIFDQDEGGNIAELEVRETFDMKNISPAGKFPDQTCPGLRPALTRLAEASKQVAERILKCVSLGLDQDLGFLAKMHRGMLSQGKDGEVGNASTLRSIHYPPIPDSLAARPGIVRCGEHSDYGTITILFQDSLGGLEAKSVTGDWLSADPITGAILINVGDLMENLTSGRFPATRHRVVVPEQEFRRRSARQSIAFFVHPDDQVMFSPLAGPDPRYPPVTALQHLENRFRATYGDKL